MARYPDKNPIYLKGCWHPVRWWQTTKTDEYYEPGWWLLNVSIAEGKTRYFSLQRNRGWWLVETMHGGRDNVTRSGPYKLLADAQRQSKEWLLADIGEASGDEKSRILKRYS